ncbi:L-aspartate oxidase [Novispirillum sp. DQ9]|uniref:L-aspartate oxidase n=1 Tax=Novispirillum sp. DQ9 TaxID=3398612 RepID=UPI003C7B673C
MSVVSLHTNTADPVIVVGSGAAGLSCALALAPRPVILVTKTAELGSGSTPWAQGGIAAAVGAGDSAADHAADTVEAGAGLVDRAVAALLAAEGPTAIDALAAHGVPFDRAADGTLSLGREAAHGRHRIVHAGGDQTGRMLSETLVRRVLDCPSISVRAGLTAVDLIVENGVVRGVTVHGPQGWEDITGAAVVLATGGIGMAWRDTTNPAEATGDGLAMAARAGALLGDLEFMQFHPTALAVGNPDEGKRPLLTEALRGAGAILRDAAGTAFMAAEHPLADLAPRDVVARAVGLRVAAGQPVFLDLRPALAAKGVDAFPQVMATCAAHGLDPLAAPVPVVPAAHYHMGGVVADADGRTSLPGLYACGEVACTGLHGANRLASNSLLEAVVVGRRTASAVGQGLRGAEPAGLHRTAARPVDIPAPVAVDGLTTTLRGIMARHVGLVREAAGLRAAAADLAALAERLDTAPEGDPESDDVRAWAEARNLLLVARLVTAFAAARRESRGAHCRLDHPRPIGAEGQRQRLTLSDLEPALGLTAPHDALAYGSQQ